VPVLAGFIPVIDPANGRYHLCADFCFKEMLEAGSWPEGTALQ
jgi:hypothetical protein